MKYLSIDTETTGLNEETCQLLSVGIILDDTTQKLPYDEVPKFHAIILRDFIQGEPFALNLNAKLIEGILKYQSAKTNEQREEVMKEWGAIFIPEEALVGQITRFLESNGIVNLKMTVAGKNYSGFDAKFLNKVEGFKNLKLHHRVLDPGSMFVDLLTDEVIPDLAECKRRAGLQPVVTHNAVEDAFDVASVIRTKY